MLSISPIRLSLLKPLGTLALLGIMFAAVPAHAEISFTGGWDNFGQYFYRQGNSTTWTADNRPGHWHMIQAADTDRIVGVTDINSPKHGFVAEVQVRPGDNLGWSSERAEVFSMLQTSPVATTHIPIFILPSSAHDYYGISIKVPTGWQAPAVDHKSGHSWGLFLQLHGPDQYAAPPAIALAAENDFHLALCAGDLRQGGTRTTNIDGHTVNLSNGSLHQGHWVEFMIDAVWSYEPTGYIAIYRRDLGEKTFTKVLELKNIATLQSQFGNSEGNNHHYWKTGYYRSATPNYTSKLWLGPFVRGTSFNEVATEAFGSP